MWRGKLNSIILNFYFQQSILRKFLIKFMLREFAFWAPSLKHWYCSKFNNNNIKREKSPTIGHLCFLSHSHLKTKQKLPSKSICKCSNTGLQNINFNLQVDCVYKSIMRFHIENSFVNGTHWCYPIFLKVLSCQERHFKTYHKCAICINIPVTNALVFV